MCSAAAESRRVVSELNAIRRRGWNGLAVNGLLPHITVNTRFDTGSATIPLFKSLVVSGRFG